MSDQWKLTKFADGTVGIHAPDGSGWLEVAALRGRFADENASLILAAVNSYASSQAEIERLKDLCRRARLMAGVMEGLTGCRGDDDWVWALQADLDAALSGSQP